MAIIFYVKLLIIASIFQQYGCQYNSADNGCGIENITAIIREHTDIIEVKIKNSVFVTQQKFTDAKIEVAESSRVLQLEDVLSQIQGKLVNLTQGLCTKSIQLLFDYKTSKIVTLQSKCLEKLKKLERSLQEKSESSFKKTASMKAKISIALQKCAIQSRFDGCSSVRDCCQQILTQSTNKIDSKTDKISKSILKAVSEQNECFKKVAKEALDLESDIKEELLECRLLSYQSDNTLDESIHPSTNFAEITKEDTITPTNETYGVTKISGEEKNYVQQLQPAEEELHQKSQITQYPLTFSENSPQNSTQYGNLEFMEVQKKAQHNQDGLSTNDSVSYVNVSKTDLVN